MSTVLKWSHVTSSVQREETEDGVHVLPLQKHCGQTDTLNRDPLLKLSIKVRTKVQKSAVTQ